MSGGMQQCQAANFFGVNSELQDAFQTTILFPWRTRKGSERESGKCKHAG